jgi:hypothetical protein
MRITQANSEHSIHYYGPAGDTLTALVEITTSSIGGFAIGPLENMGFRSAALGVNLHEAVVEGKKVTIVITVTDE